MELVDVPDSKSGGVHAPCRFDPDHRQTLRQTSFEVFFFEVVIWRTDPLSIHEERAEYEADFDLSL